MSENKTMRNFNRPKYLEHSKYLLVRFKVLNFLYMERAVVEARLEVRNGHIGYDLCYFVVGAPVKPSRCGKTTIEW